VTADIKVIHADSRDALKTIAENSLDSCVTDPPYALVSTLKRFGNTDAAKEKPKNHQYSRLSRGFMGEKWDNGDTAFDPLFWVQVYRVLKPGAFLLAFSGTRTYHRMAIAIDDAGFEIRDQIGWAFGSGFPKSHNQKGDWKGWGTALKPAWEPICMARKPLIGTVAENLAEHGTGAINIEGCRVPIDESADASQVRTMQRSRREGGDGWGMSTVVGGAQQVVRPEGRWPADIIHDGSEEVQAAFPDAARFFYTAKADADDRLGSGHPTVKPVDLMQYLVRLVTPPGGTTLDPFAGTGTTGEAAWREGVNSVLIEREAKFIKDIDRRVRLLTSGAGERKRESAKAKNADKPEDHGPLFGKDE
jgi:site-specific DNA-methyltransferase (adenine-specific)